MAHTIRNPIWRVLDGRKPERLHLVTARSLRPLRLPVGTERRLPKCQACVSYAERAQSEVRP
jgi:hypothetical protein